MDKWQLTRTIYQSCASAAWSMKSPADTECSNTIRNAFVRNSEYEHHYFNVRPNTTATTASSSSSFLRVAVATLLQHPCNSFQHEYRIVLETHHG